MNLMRRCGGLRDAGGGSVYFDCSNGCEGPIDENSLSASTVIKRDWL